VPYNPAMRKLVLFVLVLSLAGACQSAIIVDQSQLDNSSYMANFFQTDLAQSFQQTNGNIAGASIFLCCSGSSGDVTIALWDALPNAGGSMLASGTKNSAEVGSGWADVFWSPVAIIPNTTYYLVFTSNADLGIAGSESDSYPSGQVYANAGYLPFPAYDYTFKTYAEVGEAAPEPASLLLVAGGLAAALLIRRRTRTV
jgi:hypothetical protein